MSAAGWTPVQELLAACKEAAACWGSRGGTDADRFAMLCWNAYTRACARLHGNVKPVQSSGGVREQEGTGTRLEVSLNVLGLLLLGIGRPLLVIRRIIPRLALEPKLGLAVQ